MRQALRYPSLFFFFPPHTNTHKHLPIHYFCRNDPTFFIPPCSFYSPTKLNLPSCIHINNRPIFNLSKYSFSTTTKMSSSSPSPSSSPSSLSPSEASAMRHKADKIYNKLCQIYPVAPAGFLDHSNPFTLLVAVLLSAQTTDVKVNQVTPALFCIASTPHDMLSLGESKIREMIKTIGLAPRKAKHLHALCAKLIDTHNGEVPDDLQSLEALPGVGHKTASVVLLQAFGKPLGFPVDTHIHRLACRWGCGHPKSVEKTEALLAQWFPQRDQWLGLHTRIILFGREYCKATRHDMKTCPICSFAAIKEARILNQTSQTKFVPPQKNSNPYSICTESDFEHVEQDVEQEEQEEKSKNKRTSTRNVGTSKKNVKKKSVNNENEEKQIETVTKKKTARTTSLKTSRKRTRTTTTANQRDNDDNDNYNDNDNSNEDDNDNTTQAPAKRPRGLPTRAGKRRG